MKNGNARHPDQLSDLELGPAHPTTDYLNESSDYQVESGRTFVKKRRKATFDDGTRVGSKDRQ